MFATAFVLRLLIAPHVGFDVDLRQYFQAWAERLRTTGPSHFYAPGFFADYPPGYLYILWGLGKVSHAPSFLLLKLPSMVADLGLAWVAGTFAVRLASPALRERVPVRAAIAAAVLFNPAVVALSSVWGQVDVIPAFFVVWSLFLLLTGRRSVQRDAAAMVAFAVAVAMKPQSGFMFPVIAYLLLRRYLSKEASSPLLSGIRRLCLVGLPSLVVWIASGVGFGLSPTELVRFYRHSASVRPVTSAWAFNLWGMVGFWRNDQSGSVVTVVAGVPVLYVGLLAFVVATALVLWRVHVSLRAGHSEAVVITLAAAALSMLAFSLLTRMHERYLFPALACLAPLLCCRELRRAYALLSSLFLLNLWFPFAFYNSTLGVHSLGFQPVFGWVFGPMHVTDTWQKRLLSFLVVATSIVVSWLGFRWVERSRDLDDEGIGRRGGNASGGGPGSGAASFGTGAKFGAGSRGLGASAGLVRDWARQLWRGVDDATEPDPVDDPASHRGLGGRLALLGVLGGVCLFGLVILRSSLASVPNLNDTSLHLPMVQWASAQIAQGRVPLDGWFPTFTLGSSQFHHYQSFSHLVTAYLSQATGGHDQTTYLWIQYLLIALWPISVYCATRLLGWSRWTAVAAAVVSPLVVSAPGYGYEHGSYTWQGYGVYSQLWAMWLLPVSWGLTWRTVSKGRYYALAVLVTALTVATHFMTGYLAIVSVGVWVLIGWHGIARRIVRGAVVVCGSVLTAAWVLIPLLQDRTWSAQSEYYKGSIFNDSYGARKILWWTFTGRLFDNGRHPVLTILAGVGLLVCLIRWRRDERARALVSVLVLSMLLFFGRPTLGPVLKLLPGSGDMQLHRFIMGVHLAGILLAGVGVTAAGSVLLAAARRTAQLSWRSAPAVLAPIIVGLVVALLLAPAWTERIHYDRREATFVATQKAVDRTDGADLKALIGEAMSHHDGRIYAGLRANWGAGYKVGSVPVYAELPDEQAESIGFVFRTITSLSTDVEVAFDETNPAQYQIMNIRYLLMPSDRQPSVPATLLDQRGRHRLWSVDTSGYFQVVDAVGSVKADRTTVLAASRPFLASDMATRNVYPTVAFAGRAAEGSGASQVEAPAGVPGKVLSQYNEAANGEYGAAVQLDRPATVLLKATFDPRWTVEVDGVKGRVVMMAPSLLGVDVTPGRHEVVFRYRPYPHYALLLLLGVVTLAALAVVPRRRWLMSHLPNWSRPRGDRSAIEPGEVDSATSSRS